MNGNGNHDSMNLTIIDLFNSEVNFPFHGDGAQLESELSKSSPSLKNATDQETTSSGNTQYDGDAFPSQRGPFKYSATHLSFSSLGFEPDGDDIRNRSLDDAEASSQLSQEPCQPSGLYACKGTWVRWLPGSIWDTYAYAQHELSHVTWQK